MSWTHDLLNLAFLDDANNLHALTTDIEELEPKTAPQFEAGFLEIAQFDAGFLENFSTGYTPLMRTP